MGAAVNALPGGEIVPAMDRGLLDAAEFNNATSDRILGFPDVSKVCMLQSFHQNAEQFEIMFNKTEVRRAAGEDEGDHRQRRRGGLGRHVAGRRSTATRKDYIEMQQKQSVKFYKTPDAILQRAARPRYDEAAAKKASDNALFKEIEASQRAFAERAVQLGPRHQRQPPHGLQPLLRQAGAGAGAEEGLKSMPQPGHRSRRHPGCEPGWRLYLRASTPCRKLLLFVDKVEHLGRATRSRG